MSEAQPSYDELSQLLVTKDEQIVRLTEDLQSVLVQYAALKKHVFGRKSEKLSVVSNAQEALFSGATSVEVSEPSSETTVRTHTRKKGGRGALPVELPRERLVYEPEETECPECGGALKAFSEDITEELDYTPAKFLLREHVRPKCSCPKCKGEVFQAPLPPEVQIIEKGRPGAGLLSHIVLSKYEDHLPLFRQEKIFSRHGVNLSRSTMCGWVGEVAELLFPIAKEIKSQIFEQVSIHADETTLKVQNTEKVGLHTGYLWGALGEGVGVYFEYSKSRAGATAKEFLSGYEGFVHTDAYAGYNPVFLPEACIRVGCWAHARRKFVDVQKLSKKSVQKVLVIISELYKVEKKAKRMTAEERLALRAKQGVPLVAKLKELLDSLNETTLPNHPLKKAIEYTLNQWEELTVFLSNGECEIDNNPIEREIRPIALGRKNYLFAGSHEGAKRAAILYTVLGTCRTHKVNPFDYLCDVLRRVHTHPARKIEKLTPKFWTENFS